MVLSLHRLTNYVVFRRVPFVVTAASPALSQLVMTLRLAAGHYVVSTHNLASDTGSDTSFTHLRCDTSPSVDAPSTGLILTGLNIGNTNGATRRRHAVHGAKTSPPPAPTRSASSRPVCTRWS